MSRIRSILNDSLSQCRRLTIGTKTRRKTWNNKQSLNLGGIKLTKEKERAVIIPQNCPWPSTSPPHVENTCPASWRWGIPVICIGRHKKKVKDLGGRQNGQKQKTKLCHKFPLKSAIFFSNDKFPIIHAPTDSRLQNRQKLRLFWRLSIFAGWRLWRHPQTSVQQQVTTHFTTSIRQLLSAQIPFLTSRQRFHFFLLNWHEQNKVERAREIVCSFPLKRVKSAIFVFQRKFPFLKK